MLSLFLIYTTVSPAFAQEVLSSENYNEIQLSALVSFFQYEIVLEDEQTTLQNYEYAELELDLSSPWTYPGVVWNDTVPYSVLSIDFSAYEKLSGKLDITSMNKIQTVDVSNTEIDWVIVGENTELTGINTSGAPVLSLDLSKCISLQTVNCTDSAIQQLKLPQQTLQALYCDNNYLTYATLPAIDSAKDYRYAPQKDAFFIAAGDIGSITVGQKADMSSYGATTIEWYTADGKPLEGVTLVKEQTYAFEGINAEDQIYAVMTNEAYPQLILRTGLITVASKTHLGLMFWGAVLFFFIIFFAFRFMAAKKKGDPLRTDKFTDSIEEWWENLIQKISEKLPKGKKKQ